MLREDDHAPAQPTEDSERSRLDPFVVATGDAPPRDQRDLMERPFFSLAKTPRTKPILYKAADIEVQVFGMPEHGMATIWDADVLIWAASQIVAAENNGLTTSRFVRFTPYHLLRAIGRPTGNICCSRPRWHGCNRPSSPPRSATARIGVAGNSHGSTSGRK